MTVSVDPGRAGRCGSCSRASSTSTITDGALGDQLQGGIIAAAATPGDGPLEPLPGHALPRPGRRRRTERDHRPRPPPPAALVTRRPGPPTPLPRVGRRPAWLAGPWASAAGPRGRRPALGPGPAAQPRPRRPGRPARAQRGLGPRTRAAPGHPVPGAPGLGWRRCSTAPWSPRRSMVVVLVVAFVGAHRLAAGAPALARVAAGLVYAAGPFLATRLADRPPRHGPGHRRAALGPAHPPAPGRLACGARSSGAPPSGACGINGGILAGAAVLVGLVADRGERAPGVLGVALLGQLLWLVPGVVVTVQGVDPAGAENFGTRLDGPLGLLRLAGRPGLLHRGLRRRRRPPGHPAGRRRPGGRGGLRLVPTA